MIGMKVYIDGSMDPLLTWDFSPLKNRLFIEQTVRGNIKLMQKHFSDKIFNSYILTASLFRPSKYFRCFQWLDLTFQVNSVFHHKRTNPVLIRLIEELFDILNLLQPLNRQEIYKAVICCVAFDSWNKPSHTANPLPISLARNILFSFQMCIFNKLLCVVLTQ